MDDDPDEKPSQIGWVSSGTGYSWKKSFLFEKVDQAQEFSLELLNLRHIPSLFLCITDTRNDKLVEICVLSTSWDEKDVDELVRTVELSYEHHHHDKKQRKSIWPWAKDTP